MSVSIPAGVVAFYVGKLIGTYICKSTLTTDTAAETWVLGFSAIKPFKRVVYGQFFEGLHSGTKCWMLFGRRYVRFMYESLIFLDDFNILVYC
jgi:hypothetical protein